MTKPQTDKAEEKATAPASGEPGAEVPAADPGRHAVGPAPPAAETGDAPKVEAFRPRRINFIRAPKRG